jgi:hypothetical protein
MRRREFLIGTAATAAVVALPRPASAFAPIAHDIANLLRDAVRGGVLSTAECRARPNAQYYDVTMRGWTITMYRALEWSAAWEIQAQVDEAVDPHGRLWDQKDWGIMVVDDPLLLLTADERQAFDRLVVASLPWRLR